MNERGNDAGSWLRNAFGVLLRAIRRFDAKGGWVLSSHVAMSTMLSLFPFILFVVALGGFLTNRFELARQITGDANEEDMIELLFGAWPDAIKGPILAELDAVLAADHSRLMTIGGLLVLYFASNGIDAVRVALTRAYHDEDHRPFWKVRLLCLVFVVFGAIAVLLAAAAAVAWPLYTTFLKDSLHLEFPSWLPVGKGGTLLVQLVPVLTVVALHVFLPGRRHTMRQILPGIVLTILLWWAVGWGFSYYVRSFGSYSATYAGLAGAMAALIFLYLIAAILILGAEYNGALIDKSNGTDTDSGQKEA